MNHVEGIGFLLTYEQVARLAQPARRARVASRRNGVAVEAALDRLLDDLDRHEAGRRSGADRAAGTAVGTGRLPLFGTRGTDARASEWLTTAEVARLLGVSQRRVTALCEGAKLVVDRRGGRAWRIRRDSVEAYAERRRSSRGPGPADAG